METTEKIVEAYVRYIKGWFTIPNIKCKGQHEIDLLAVDACDAKDIRRYHIESGVLVAQGFSPLTNEPFSREEFRIPVKKPGQRRTLGCFIEREFTPDNVKKRLLDFGFEEGNHRKVIVSWGWKDEVPETAKEAGIELWDFREIVKAIAEAAGKMRTYFIDDTMRTLQLMAKATGRR